MVSSIYFQLSCFCCLLPLINGNLTGFCRPVLLKNSTINILIQGVMIIGSQLGWKKPWFFSSSTSLFDASFFAYSWPPHSLFSSLHFSFLLNRKIKIVTTYTFACIHFWKGWKIICFILSFFTGSQVNNFLIVKHCKQMISEDSNSFYIMAVLAFKELPKLLGNTILVRGAMTVGSKFGTSQCYT